MHALKNNIFFLPMVLIVALINLRSALASYVQKLPPIPNRTLTICLYNQTPELRPLTYVGDGQIFPSSVVHDYLEGLSVDVSTSIFTKMLNWSVQYKFVAEYNKALYSTRMGSGCDLLVGRNIKSYSHDYCNPQCTEAPSSAITDDDFAKHACCIDFSHTYWIGGYSLMARHNNKGMSYVDIFFQRDVTNAIAVGVIGCFAIAHLIWILEHRMYAKNPILPLYYQFRPHYLDGLKDGMWFSTATVLGDVGASLKLPQTGGGRVIAIVWVMFGLFLFSFVTSVISSTLTEAKLETQGVYSIQDAAGKRVCMKAGPYERTFTSSFAGVGILKTVFAAEADCYEALEHGRVDAVFGLREDMVAYFLSGHANGKLITSVQKSENYAFAWPELWEYAYPVNSAILALKEDSQALAKSLDPRYPAVLDRWYKGDTNNVLLGSPIPTGYNWAVIIVACVLAAIYAAMNAFILLARMLGPDLGSSSDEFHNETEKSMLKSIVRVASRLSNTVVPEEGDKFSVSRSHNSMRSPSSATSVDMQRVARALGGLRADVGAVSRHSSQVLDVSGSLVPAPLPALGHAQAHTPHDDDYEDRR